MTNQEYEEVLRALLQTPDMKRMAEGMKTIVRTTYPLLFGEGQSHPCELCGVTCEVAASYETGDTMVQHHAPCGALCGRGLYHGYNPHFATKCPNCNPTGSVKGDSTPSE